MCFSICYENDSIIIELIPSVEFLFWNTIKHEVPFFLCEFVIDRKNIRIIRFEIDTTTTNHAIMALEVFTYGGTYGKIVRIIHQEDVGNVLNNLLKLHSLVQQYNLLSTPIVH